MSRKTYHHIFFICTLIILLCASLVVFIYGINKEKSAFVFNKHLEDTILTINDEKYDLQYISYYIMKIEGDTNECALAYNSSNPKSYWNLFISNTFVKDAAKDAAIDTLIRDILYYNEAIKLDISLTNKELDTASSNTDNVFKAMTGKMMDNTNFTYEYLFNIEKRNLLAQKYAQYIVDKDHLEQSSLEVGGDYYNSLRESYGITINYDVWDNITLGEITIN